jgi:uncharacterized integral membrane protein (TIGR00698 family)
MQYGMVNMSKNEIQKRKPSWIEDAIFGCTVREVPALVPGIILAAAVVAAAIQLTNLMNSALGHRGVISYIIVAILAGIIIRTTIGMHSIFQPGISYCLKKLLRLGIIMMGIRLSIYDVLNIGAWGVPIVILCILTGLFVTTYFTRLLKLPERLGTLIAVGTSICGASAIVATAPGIEAKDEEVSYAVANIIAMLVYPYIAHLIFSGDTTMVGLFTGTSIHETAQVAGAGLIYDQTFPSTSNPTAADAAMVTKLVRNTLMAVVIPAMAYIYTRRSIKSGASSGGAKINPWKLFPLFVIGFIAMAIIRSIGDAGIESGGQAFAVLSNELWSNIIHYIKQWSGYILATAMAGVGLGTSLKTMKGLGIKPFYVGLVSATIVGVTSIILVLILGPHVQL